MPENEVKFKITTEADVDGAREVAGAIGDIEEAARKSKGPTEDVGKVVEDLTVKKRAWREIAKGVAFELPLLGRAVSALLSPMTALTSLVAVATGAFVRWFTSVSEAARERIFAKLFEDALPAISALEKKFRDSNAKLLEELTKLAAGANTTREDLERMFAAIDKGAATQIKLLQLQADLKKERLPRGTAEEQVAALQADAQIDAGLRSDSAAIRRQAAMAKMTRLDLATVPLQQQLKELTPASPEELAKADANRKRLDEVAKESERIFKEQGPAFLEEIEKNRGMIEKMTKMAVAMPLLLPVIDALAAAVEADEAQYEAWRKAVEIRKQQAQKADATFQRLSGNEAKAKQLAGEIGNIRRQQRDLREGIRFDEESEAQTRGLEDELRGVRDAKTIKEIHERDAKEWYRRAVREGIVTPGGREGASAGGAGERLGAALQGYHEMNMGDHNIQQVGQEIVGAVQGNSQATIAVLQEILAAIQAQGAELHAVGEEVRLNGSQNKHQRAVMS